MVSYNDIHCAMVKNLEFLPWRRIFIVDLLMEGGEMGRIEEDLKAKKLSS